MERQKTEVGIQNKKVYVIFIDGGVSPRMIHDRLP